MPRQRATLDTLRSTPPIYGGRDAAVFPEAAAAETVQGCPTRYCLAVAPTRVTLVHADFHLPPFVADALRARHAQYCDAWPRVAPSSWPRQGVARSAFGRDCLVTVRREDAAEWIRVLRAAALECFHPQEREHWLRRALATVGSASP